MIFCPSNSINIRRGAAVVEMAVVSVIMMLLAFGILEYCRYLFVLHLANNSARDVARFAAVHTNGATMPADPTSISQSDLVNLFSSGVIGNDVIGPGMSNLQSNITNISVQIFTVDSNGLSRSPAVALPDSSLGGAWNNAGYGKKIAVKITGDYLPILPDIMFLPSSIPVQITVMVSSEAN